MNLKNVLCAAILALASLGVHADDWGCQVVLCLANPQGPTAVKECVPPITKLWRELAKGHGFPFCDMNSGGASGNSAVHQWASGAFCPPQYTYWGGVEGTELLCKFAGVVTIGIKDKPYNRTWWNGSTTVTENMSLEASSTPGASTQFEDDYAKWKAMMDATAKAASD